MASDDHGGLRLSLPSQVLTLRFSPWSPMVFTLRFSPWPPMKTRVMPRTRRFTMADEDYDDVDMGTLDFKK
uniref:Uncharacterized protein n=1 Tax=Lotus japonicus TaxID=34305 RepID=I3RZL4_LOTJA|nr:unknown [Lotus japonicus]